MELAVFFLFPRPGQYSTIFASCHSVLIFSGAVDLLTMYNFQCPLKDTLALSRTQGCHFSEKVELGQYLKHIQNTGFLL